MIFSTRTALQLLVALSAVVAAPTHHDGDMLSARELSNLNHPEARSVMLGHQEYSRGYEDLSVLTVRAKKAKTCVLSSGSSGSKGSGKKLQRRALTEEDKQNLNRQMAVHVEGLRKAKASYNDYKAKVAAEKDKAKKAKLQETMASAKEMMDYEQDEIDSCKSLLASG
jgi:hypothetical protein